MAKKSKKTTVHKKASKAASKKKMSVTEIEIGYTKNIGHLSFIAGVIVAIIAGISSKFLQEEVVLLVLVILGTVVGLMNISQKEHTRFLVAAIALMVAGVGKVIVIPTIGITLQAILENIGTFVAPAAIVVALKSIKRLAEE